MLERLIKSVPGLADLTLDDRGGFAVSFGDGVVVNVACDEQLEILIFYARLGEVPLDEIESVYPLLLEANVLWAGTSGATLGVTPGDRSVVLAYQDRIRAIDAARFETLLRSIAAMAAFWRERIGMVAGTTPVAAKDSADGSDDDLSTRALPLHWRV